MRKKYSKTNGSYTNKCGTQNHAISISVPANKAGLIEMVTKIAEDRTLKMDRSKVIMNAVEYFFGQDPYDTEIKVMKLYTDRILALPKMASMELGSIIKNELKVSSILVLAEKWKITKQELGYMLYAYVMRNSK